MVADVSPVSWLDRLNVSARRGDRLVLGLMSGTSANAIDAALCRITGGGPRPGTRVDLLHFCATPYPADLRALVVRSLTLSTREVAEVHARVGDAFGAAAVAAASAAGIALDQLDLIGSHGQTVYHHSTVPGAARVTLQLGCGDRIAEQTGVPVFCDFRARDVAAGGEGAPLTPYADLVLFGSGGGGRRAILNLGGIGNITVLASDPAEVIGFDTGPANAPLDRLARMMSGGAKQCDEDGTIARSGRCNEALLAELLSADAFIARPPPKSTGFEAYGDEFVAEVVRRAGGTPTADLMATLVEFVASTVLEAIVRHVKGPPVTEVVLAGGGSRNPLLVERLRSRLGGAGVQLLIADALGVPADAREAIAFALLANDALLGLPTSLPRVTGCAHPVTLGKLCLPGAP